MKKIILLFVVFLSIQLSSCKSEKKQNDTAKTEVTAAFSLKNAENTVLWTAFKTSDRVPVKGRFKKVDIIKNGSGNTIKEAIDGTEFSIPVSSIFSGDSSRDFKLQKFFFGVMENTKLLSGTLNIENDSTGYAMLSMNSVSQKLPFTYTISQNEFKLNAQMNLDLWNGQKAVDSLNVACKDLHKGSDGVSKTWNEVVIEISSVFN